MHKERFVAEELYCMLQVRQQRAVVNLQSTQVLESMTVERERVRFRLPPFQTERSTLQPIFIRIVSSLEIFDIVVNVAKWSQ